MQAEQFSVEKTRSLVAEHGGVEGPLLPILHAVQGTFGHVPDEAVRVIAAELNLTRADVYGVVSFYRDFRRTPAGVHVVRLCRAEACQSMGCEALVERAESRLAVACGETTQDGKVTLEEVYCLGLCGTAPSAMVDGKLVGRLDKVRLDGLLDTVTGDAARSGVAS